MTLEELKNLQNNNETMSAWNNPTTFDKTVDVFKNSLDVVNTSLVTVNRELQNFNARREVQHRQEMDRLLIQGAILEKKLHIEYSNVSIDTFSRDRELAKLGISVD